MWESVVTATTTMAPGGTLETWKLVSYLSCPLLMTLISFVVGCNTRQNQDLEDILNADKLTKGMTPVFKDEEMEEKWQRKYTSLMVSLGAQAILFLLCVHVIEGLREFVWEGVPYLECKIGADYNLVALAQMALCGVMGMMALVCWKFPNDVIYYTLLVCFLCYEFACANPPFRLTCPDLVSECEDHQDAEKLVKPLDCSLQGRTEQQLLMTTLLFMPWMVPLLANMLYVWITFSGLFTLSTVIHRTRKNTAYFTWYHILVSVLLMTFASVLAHIRKKWLERTQRMVFVSDETERETTEKMFRIFQYMMPAHIVVPMLLDPTAHIAESIDRVSILFVVIADFGQFTETMSSHELLVFLNDIFESMDSLCLEHNVTKVETVGEEYVACVGVVPRDRQEYEETKSHTSSLERLVEVAGKMLELQKDNVAFKMGIHTGPIVAGVIGKKLPRFRLFGDTINTAARMMQKAPPGRLQFGAETKQDWPTSFDVDDRGEVEMKGKGMVKAWLFPTEEEVKISNRLKQNSTKPKIQKRKSLLNELLDDRPAPRKKGIMQTLAGVKMQTLVDSFGGIPASFESNTSESTKAMNVNFDHVLSEIDRQKAELTGVMGKGMSPELEEKWLAKFHRGEVCNNLYHRINLGLVALSILTCLEACYMLFLGESWRTPHPFFHGGWRPSVFMGCRVSIFLILLGWWLVPEAFLHKNMRFVQFGMLFSICTICCLFFVSYDMIQTGSTFDHISWIYDENYKNNNFKAPFDQVFTVLFVLVFYMATTVQPLHFFQSFAFPVVACVLVTPFSYLINNKDEDGVNWWQAFGTEERTYGNEGRTLFVTCSFVSTFLAYVTEVSHRQRFKAAENKDVAEQRILDILATLMPPMLVKDLRQSNLGEVTHTYKKATIAQSDLCGFTKLAATRTPQEVVMFVSDLFGRFDALTDDHGVYKVETIGDAYIAGQAEQPLTEKNQPVSVILFGLAMVRACNEWAKGMGVDVKCRVGVHHGECVGGVVGRDMQRYHLFGHFMTSLDVLEATSEEGVAQVSSACKAAVENQLEAEKRTAEDAFGGFEARTEGILRTSKGEVHELDEVGGATFLVRGRRNKH
jgi:class 3 adenylate cyclase